MHITSILTTNNVVDSCLNTYFQWGPVHTNNACQYLETQLNKADFYTYPDVTLKCIHLADAFLLCVYICINCVNYCVITVITATNTTQKVHR